MLNKCIEELTNVVEEFRVDLPELVTEGKRKKKTILMILSCNWQDQSTLQMINEQKLNVRLIK